MSDAFYKWIKEIGLEVMPLNDGSGQGYVIDKKKLRRLKMHLSNGNFTALKNRVELWMKEE